MKISEVIKLYEDDLIGIDDKLIVRDVHSYTDRPTTEKIYVTTLRELSINGFFSKIIFNEYHEIEIKFLDWSKV